MGLLVRMDIHVAAALSLETMPKVVKPHVDVKETPHSLHPLTSA